MAKRVQFACDWRPLGYHLHAIGGHSVTRQETSRQEGCKRLFLHQNYIFFSIDKSTSLTHASDYSADSHCIFGLENALVHMDEIAARKQILHALAASCLQSRQFFASTLQEQLFE
jgi:hypothetical protein